MNERTRKRNGNGALVRPQAYPWNAREILSDLRGRLVKQLHESMTFKRLGEVVGEKPRTAYYWFEEYHQRPLLGFFCCLERLTGDERHAFIDRYCRIFPSLEGPELAHATSKVEKLRVLLQKTCGLTIVTGTQPSRSFMIHAMGNSYRRFSTKRHLVAGINLSRPTRCVPLETCNYFDGSGGLDHVRPAVMKVWPKILTSSATLILLNDVWAIHSLRADILRLAARRHVVLAIPEAPELAMVRQKVFTPLHIVSLSEPKSAKGKIRIDCRRIKTLKRPENWGNC